MINKVCIYCSSSMLIDEKFNQMAISMGTLLAQNKYTIVFGGGSRGLMELPLKAALENDGIVYGFILHFYWQKEGHNSNLDHLEIVDSMHIRKQKWLIQQMPLLFYLGGFGTLDELFEIILMETTKYSSKTHHCSKFLFLLGSFESSFLTM